MEQHNQLNLRELQDTDKGLFQKWLCEEHVAKWYEHPSDWMNEIEKRDGEYSWLHHFIAEVDGAPVGFGQFYEYRRGGEAWHGDVDTEGAYSIDYLIGRPDCIGKGLGKELIAALIGKVALQNDARLIIVQPAPENKASCGALLSAGFVFDESNKLYRFAL